MKTVAVIEDNPDNRLLVRALLEDRYRVEEYEDGAKALEGFRTRRPDAVLMDISLPGMDGVAVLQAMQDDPALRDIQVVALTAHAMRGDREKYLGHGFREYLSKPLEDEELLYRVLERMTGEKP